MTALASLTAQSQSDVPVSPGALGQIWDAEHVSPPVPPLVDHGEVVARLTAVVSQAPSRRQNPAGSSSKQSLMTQIPEIRGRRDPFVVRQFVVAPLRR